MEDAQIGRLNSSLLPDPAWGVKSQILSRSTSGILASCHPQAGDNTQYCTQASGACSSHSFCDQPNAWVEVIFQVQLYNTTELCYSIGSPATQGGPVTLLAILGREGRKNKYDLENPMWLSLLLIVLFPPVKSWVITKLSQMVMGGGLAADCGTPRGTKLAGWVGYCLAITSSFLSPYHNKNSSSDGGWLQRRSLPPLGDYKGNEEQRMREGLQLYPKQLSFLP